MKGSKKPMPAGKGGKGGGKKGGKGNKYGC